MAGQLPADSWRRRYPLSQWNRKIRVAVDSFAGKGSNPIAGWNFCDLQAMSPKDQALLLAIGDRLLKKKRPKDGRRDPGKD